MLIKWNGPLNRLKSVTCKQTLNCCLYFCVQLWKLCLLITIDEPFEKYREKYPQVQFLLTLHNWNLLILEDHSDSVSQHLQCFRNKDMFNLEIKFVLKLYFVFQYVWLDTIPRISLRSFQFCSTCKTNSLCRFVEFRNCPKCRIHFHVEGVGPRPKWGQQWIHEMVTDRNCGGLYKSAVIIRAFHN